MFDDYERYLKIPEEYEPLKITPYEEKVIPFTLQYFNILII